MSRDFPEPRPFQAAAHEKLREGRAAGHRCQMLMAPTGSGKCLGRGTPVLLANGDIIPVEDVQVGDRLMGPDGTGRNVLSLGRGREMMYRVVPVKGDPYVVNASHILSLRKTILDHTITLADGQRVLPDDEFVEVEAQVFARSSRTAQHCLKGWRSDAIEVFEREIDEDDRGIPPYILGAWLGDGTLGKAAISKPRCRMVDEWIAYGQSVGYGCREIVNEGDEHDCPTWHLTNGHDGQQFNIVACWLEILGVLRDKHVPDDYKFAPASVRLEVLAGLIDSDGHVHHKGIDWISKSERLANDFAFLARSLGFACYINPEIKGIKATGFEGLYWRCHVSGDTDRIPTRDKRAGPRLQKKRHLVHGIKLEALGVDDYYGFQLDGDGLFLLGDFTVTHNTYLGLRAISETLKKGRRAMFVCDRRTLIGQTSETADRYGLDYHSVMMADHWRKNAAPFVIASAQTLARRQWPDVDVIIIDEAHTQLSTWVNHIQQTKATVVGLSATPFSRGLGKLFTNLVNAATMADLVDEGILAPLRVMSCTPTDMRGAATKGGEWTEEAATERGVRIVGDVVADWIRYGENRKTIVFASSIKHCEELCRSFREVGVAAAMFTTNTTDAERQALLEDYRQPDSVLRVLISVEALSKGFDVPDVSCVVDCRPLRKSLSTAIQMWGRGMRSSPETGKQDCLLLDHSHNILRFSEDFERIYHAGLDKLDDGELLDKKIRRDEDEEKEVKACPACGYKPFRNRCMACGHERRVAAMVEAAPGEMREIKIGKTKYADDHRHLWEQCVAYCRTRGNPDTVYGRACHAYKDIAGMFPPKHYKLETTPEVPITRAVLNKIRSRNIAFFKAREKEQRRAAA